MNEENLPEDGNSNENSNIDAETLNAILSQYFKTKEEQATSNNEQIEESSTVLQELQSINHNLAEIQKNTQLNNNIAYLILVAALALFLLVMFYRYLRNFV